MNAVEFRFLDPTMTGKQDRRRKSALRVIQRELWAWSMEGDMLTIQRIVMVLMAVFFIAVCVWSKLLLSFPPLFQRGVVVFFPFWVWPILLFFGLLWQIKTTAVRKIESLCARRNAAVFSFFVLLGIVMPMYPKTPMFAFVVFVTSMAQGTVAARIWHKCRKVK